MPEGYNDRFYYISQAQKLELILPERMEGKDAIDILNNIEFVCLNVRDDLRGKIDASKNSDPCLGDGDILWVDFKDGKNTRKIGVPYKDCYRVH